MRPSIRISQRDIAVRDHAVDVVCRACGDVTPDEVMSRNRSRRVAFARALAMWLIMPKATMTSERVGTLFDRGHAAVLHAVKVIDDMLSMPNIYPREIDIINQARASHTSWQPQEEYNYDKKD